MPQTSEPDLLADYILEPDLAKQWKVTERTLRRYRHMPNGLPYLLLGGSIYYRIQSAAAWLASLEKRPNPRKGGQGQVRPGRVGQGAVFFSAGSEHRTLSKKPLLHQRRVLEALTKALADVPP